MSFRCVYVSYLLGLAMKMVKSAPLIVTVCFLHTKYMLRSKNLPMLSK